MALLKRIQPPEPEPITEPTEPSRELMYLVGRVEARHWQTEEIERVKKTIADLKNDLKFIKHAVTCERCLLELQLSVERYGGSRGLLWWLDLANETPMWDEEFEISEPWKSAPRPYNYQIGSYWTGSSDDTIRFIKDRITWAEKVAKKEIRVSTKYLHALKRWDLESELPPESIFFWGAKVWSVKN